MMNQLKSNYSKPREVQIRIVFLRIGDIDTLNEKFYAEILIESKWEENKLANEFISSSSVDSQFSDEIEEDKELSDATKYWNPKLYVENALNEKKKVHYKMRKEINNKLNISKKVLNNSSNQTRNEQQQQQPQPAEESIQFANNNNSFTYWLYEYQRIKGNFFEKLELDYFPVDIQDISIVLTTARSDKEVKLVEMRSKISSVKHNILDRHIWHLYHHIDVKTDYDPDHGDYNNHNHAYNTITSNNINEAANVTNFCENCEQQITITTTRFNTLRNNAISYLRKLSSFPHMKGKSTYRDIIRHPLIKFQLKVARKSGYYYWNAYLLIFLITSVVFTTFSIDLDKPQFRLPVTATLLLTSVTFRWIYSGKCLPTVNYLTSLDKYSLSSLICIYICLMWHGGFPFLLKLFGISNDKLVIIDRYVCVSLIVFYISVQIALVVWLRRAYLIRASLIKKDENYFKKALQCQLRNSMMENLIMEPSNSQAYEKDKRISLFSVNFNQHDSTAKQGMINDATKTIKTNKNRFYINESINDDSE